MKKNTNQKKENEINKDDEIDILDAECTVDDTAGGSEVEALTKQNEELNDRLQRSLAEFDNFRKRTLKEKASMYDDGVISTIEKMLPVIDNFERAIAAAPNKDDSLCKGVEMIYSQLLTILKDIGIEPIDCKGKEFNPEYHNAVSHEENEEFGNNMIIEELLKGYMYKEKVIRHSMVKVAN